MDVKHLFCFVKSDYWSEPRAITESVERFSRSELQSREEPRGFSAIAISPADDDRFLWVAILLEDWREAEPGELVVASFEGYQGGYITLPDIVVPPLDLSTTASQHPPLMPAVCNSHTLEMVQLALGNSRKIQKFWMKR